MKACQEVSKKRRGLGGKHQEQLQGEEPNKQEEDEEGSEVKYLILFGFRASKQLKGGSLTLKCTLIFHTARQSRFVNMRIKPKRGRKRPKSIALSQLSLKIDCYRKIVTKKRPPKVPRLKIIIKSGKRSAVRCPLLTILNQEISSLTLNYYQMYVNFIFNLVLKIGKIHPLESASESKPFCTELS